MINRRNDPNRNRTAEQTAELPIAQNGGQEEKAKAAPEKTLAPAKVDPGAEEARQRIDALAEQKLAELHRAAENFLSRFEKSTRRPLGEEPIEAHAVGGYNAPIQVREIENAILENRLTASKLPSQRTETAARQGEPEKKASSSSEERAGRQSAQRHGARTGSRASQPTGTAREEKLRQLQRLSDEVAAELPQEFFRELSGGISLSDRVKRHSQSDPSRPLLILGEYRNDRVLGRSIMLYGGSIISTYGNLPETELKKELRRIIRHEFTHHIESLSGTRDLEIEDEIRLEAYKEGIAEDAKTKAKNERQKLCR